MSDVHFGTYINYGFVLCHENIGLKSRVRQQLLVAWQLAQLRLEQLALCALPALEPSAACALQMQLDTVAARFAVVVAKCREFS